MASSSKTDTGTCNNHCCVPMCNSNARYDPTMHFPIILQNKKAKRNNGLQR